MAGEDGWQAREVANTNTLCERYLGLLLPPHLFETTLLVLALPAAVVQAARVELVLLLFGPYCLKLESR